MYICQKCGNHTNGTIKQIEFEVYTPAGMAHEYKDCIVCECGEIICCAPDITPEQAYLDFLKYMDAQDVAEV